ncbi:MAG: hypothetical protein AB1461_10585 [Thermodesulfobacteriota bacterium]
MSREIHVSAKMRLRIFPELARSFQADAAAPPGVLLAVLSDYRLFPLQEDGMIFNQTLQEPNQRNRKFSGAIEAIFPPKRISAESVIDGRVKVDTLIL